MDGTQSAAAALVVFLGTWTVINVLFWLAGKLRRHASSSPTSTESEHKEDDDVAVSVELVSPLHLRLTTCVLNDPIFKLTQNRISTSWAGSWALCKYFDAGIYVALFSMVACMCVLIYAGMQIASLIALKFLESGIFATIYSQISTHFLHQTNDTDSVTVQTVAGREFSKRSLEPQPGYLQPGSGGFQLLRPVIPGVTLPLGHIWYYLLALVVCAVVHELGHALAAGVLGRVRLHKVGVFIMGMYPGVFVDLPREHLEQQSLWTQLGVVCAGVWHNAVTALLVWLLVYSGGLSCLFTAAGWSHTSEGVTVVHVARSSPLSGKLPLLSTIHQLDDIQLSPYANSTKYAGSAIAKWTSVLTASHDNRETNDAGFCVQPEDNLDDGLCCEMSPGFPLGESPDGDIHCFESYEVLPERQVVGHVLFPADHSSMCFDLQTVLGHTDSSLRCQQDSDCVKIDPGRGRVGDVLSRRQPSICVLPSSPYRDGRVVRLYYRTAEGEEGLLIYAGSPVSLWLEVQVSLLTPRWQWLPYRLPSWVESLVQYVLSFSLAFCLLNAIPAWNLDGDHALRLVLLMIQGRGSETTDTFVLERDSSDESVDGSAECDGDVSESDAASSVSAAGSSHLSTLTGEMQLNALYERIYSVTTRVTTVLLGWCIVGSIVLLAL